MRNAGGWAFPCAGSTGFLLFCLAAAVPVAAQDDITLIVEATADQNGVQLTWTGGLATYRVFRSELAMAVTDPQHEIASTSSQVLLDDPPEAIVQYYRVTSCVLDPPERCDGLDNDCNGVVDDPGSEESCDLANATTACVAGACEIAACDPGYHDLDGSALTGCECASDVDEPAPFQASVFSTGQYLGAFNDCDFIQTISRNLVPLGDTEDFYRFYMNGSILCAFALGVSLSVPAGTNYDLLLYKWNGVSWSLLGSSTNSGSGSEQVQCGGCNVVCGGCGCSGCSEDGDYGVLVKRVAGAAVTCDAYSLSIVEN